jgi:cytochrome b561
MLLAMLFIGVSMVASLGDYGKLVAIHRPLGIMILILAAVRLINRKLTKLPPFPPTMSARERFAASSSEKLLYALMFALPLVGWGDVVSWPLSHRHVRTVASAAHSPGQLYFSLRRTHTILPTPQVEACLLNSSHLLLVLLPKKGRCRMVLRSNQLCGEGRAASGSGPVNSNLLSSMPRPSICETHTT